MATKKNKSKSSKSKKTTKKIQTTKTSDAKKQNDVNKKNEDVNKTTTKKQTTDKKTNETTVKKQAENQTKNTSKSKSNKNKSIDNNKNVNKQTPNKQTSNKQTSAKSQNKNFETVEKKVEENNKKEKNNKEEAKKTNQKSLQKEADSAVQKEELEEIKELIKAENKEIIGKEKNDKKAEYVQKLIEKGKKINKILVPLIITLLFLIILSTIFAILNASNSKIINGVSIKNIDVSNLSKEDAVDKLIEAVNKELIPEIDLVYGQDYNVTLKSQQIEFIYDIKDSVEDAYKIGRTGDILIDNYAIVCTAIFGKKLDMGYSYNGELLNEIVEDIRSKLPGIVIQPAYYIDNDKLFVNKGTDGIEVKKEELKNQIILSILERNANKITDGFKQKIEIPTEYVKASDIDMKLIQKEIFRDPQNAYFEIDPYKIYPDVDGVDLAISAEEAQQIVNQEDKEEYCFDLKITGAEYKVDDLGKEAFPDMISSYSTKYDARNINRSTNLKIAAEKINGKVLMPGEEFSFNKIVGKRTVEAGYKDAAIYADGGVVDGLAGGICQISSTLYNSVLLANLQITERRNHSFTTSYAPAGRDATVVWGTTDFRFINTRTYPIKIEATVNGGIAEFKLYGMKEEVEYEVRILPIRTQSIPYRITYEEDPALIPGQQFVKQSGHSGCKVTTYKELVLNGEVVSKEPISNDTYQPMRTIIRVAPGQVPAQ